MSVIDPTDYETHPLHGFYAWSDMIKGIYYGPGCTKTALPKLLQTLRVKKALLVTGKSLYTKTDVVTRIEAILKEHDAYAATFHEIGQHSPIADIDRGIDVFKQHECDVIVAVGGGSPVDASKVMLYHLQKERGGPTPPQIAIPTTLSAAEYSVGGGYTNQDGRKVAVSSPELAPSGVILDAELTLATPERLWLSTGIRALDHSVENLYRPLVPIPLKMLCYAAMADLFKYLPQSKANPQSLEIRQKLQVAAWMSLWPHKREKYSALGLSHSLGHALGATYGIPHGITSCLTLAPTVKLKAQIASQDDKEDLAKALSYLHEPSTGSVEGDISKLSSLIDDLVLRLGLRSTLSEYKVPVGDLPGIAAHALARSDDPHEGRVVEMLKGLYD